MCDAAYSKALIAWTKANDLPIVTVRHYFTFLGFDTAEKIAQQQPNLSEIFKEPTYDELTQALEQWLNPSEDDANTSVSTSSHDEDEAPFSPNVSKVDDVSAAFDELFNE